MSPDTLAVLAVGVALAGLQLALFRDLKGDIRDLRREHGERLARIEGAVLGPARPEPPKETTP